MKHNEEAWGLVTKYRWALDTYVLGWRHLLFEARSQWRRIFVQYNLNRTWNPKEILSAFEVMRMGHPVGWLEMFKAHPLPPPIATVGSQTLVGY